MSFSTPSDFKFNFCKICTSGVFTINWIFLKKTIALQKYGDVIPFHFCDS